MPASQAPTDATHRSMPQTPDIAARPGSNTFAPSNGPLLGVPCTHTPPEGTASERGSNPPQVSPIGQDAWPGNSPDALPEMLRMTCSHCTHRVVLDRIAAWGRVLEVDCAAQACVIDASGRMMLAQSPWVNRCSLARLPTRALRGTLVRCQPTHVHQQCRRTVGTCVACV